MLVCEIQKSAQCHIDRAKCIYVYIYIYTYSATHDISFMQDSCVTRSELTAGFLNTDEYFWARVEASLHCLHFILIT